jgi:hypothetical protein
MMLTVVDNLLVVLDRLSRKVQVSIDDSGYSNLLS